MGFEIRKQSSRSVMGGQVFVRWATQLWIDLKADHYAAFRSVPYENGGLVASWGTIPTSTSSYVESWGILA